MEELIKKLKEEIAALELEFRVELPREILKARAHGDLKENAEYHAAKERQGLVNARLNQLNGRLREISMIDITKLPRDKAGLCSEVTVLDVDKDIKVKYTLVTSEEVDVAKGLISTSSPIGRSLLRRSIAGNSICRSSPSRPSRRPMRRSCGHWRGRPLHPLWSSRRVSRCGATRASNAQRMGCRASPRTRSRWPG